MVARVKVTALRTVIPVQGVSTEVLKDQEVEVTDADLEQIKAMEYVGLVVEVVEAAPPQKGKGK